MYPPIEGALSRGQQGNEVGPLSKDLCFTRNQTRPPTKKHPHKHSLDLHA